jgi:nucleoside-diphosphate-sugar epimerase
LRNFVHVEDLASVVEAVLRHGLTGTFPVLHPESHRVRAVAELAFRVFGRGGRVMQVVDKPDLREVYFPSGGDIYRRTGLSPGIDLAKGLRLMRDGRG